MGENVRGDVCFASLKVHILIIPICRFFLLSYVSAKEKEREREKEKAKHLSEVVNKWFESNWNTSQRSLSS
jgi:hypothetical protein